MVKKVVKRKPRAKPKPKPSSGIAQTQQVTINLTKPSTSVKRYVQVKEQPKQFLPMMPSFNINPAQPQPISDLAKVLGMLIPKVQTESALGSAIPVKTKLPEKPRKTIGELKDPKETPSLGDAIIASKVEDTSFVTAEPVYTKDVETEIPQEKEGVPIQSYLNVKKPKKQRRKKSQPDTSTPILENFYTQEETVNPAVTLERRYEMAFGYPYEGSPNIKESDFRRMIVNREKFNTVKNIFEKPQFEK
jgi:hypothetical protein